MLPTSRSHTDSFHVDPTIVISTKYSTHSFRIPLLILLAIAGCLCTLKVCISMVQPEFHKEIFWAASVFTVLAVCILSILPKRLHLLGHLPLLAGIILVLRQRELIIRGAKLFYNDFYSTAHHTDTKFFELLPKMDEPEAITWFLCCCAVILCSLIARLLMRSPKFIPYFLLTFIPIEFGLYQGLSMSLPAILIVIITWFGVLALQFAERHAASGNIHSVRRSNAASCSIAALFLTASAVLITVLVTSHFQLTTDPEIQEKRQNLRHDIENLRWEDVTDSLAKLSIGLGIMEDPEVRTLGSKSSLQYRNEDEVQITFSSLPSHGIYLKNYTGSVYEENQWHVLPEEIWKKNEEMLALFEQFECMPQLLPFMSNQGLYETEDNAVIEIESLIRTDLSLLPYAAYAHGGIYQNDTGVLPRNKDSYSFLFSEAQDFSQAAQLPLSEFYMSASGFNFEDPVTSTFFDKIHLSLNQDMFSVTSRHSPYIENVEYRTQALQAILAENFVYRDFVYETYTDIPESAALTEVYASLPSEIHQIAQNKNVWETLGAIRRFLAQQSTYSLSPGKTPETRDFINYFLLENHEGYCMHYATAGTVLARYFGIPARYCEGYVISEEEMKNGTKNEDGSVTVILKDSAGHAWCEFYVDGYGWIPYELTPGYYGEETIPPEETAESSTDTTTEPTSASEAFSEETSTYTTTVTTNRIEMNGTALTSSIDTENSVNQSHTPLMRILKVLLGIAAAIFLLALILSIFVLLRKYSICRRKREFCNSDTTAAIQSIYRYLMRLLEQVSLTPDNQQMLDFAEYTAQELNAAGYDGAGASAVIQLALAADMGGKTPSEEQIQTSIRYAERLALRISRNKKTSARLVMMYIHHLI